MYSSVDVDAAIPPFAERNPAPSAEPKQLALSVLSTAAKMAGGSNKNTVSMSSQPAVSVTVTTGDPPHKLEAVRVVSPLDHK